MVQPPPPHNSIIWTPAHPDFYAVLHGRLPPGEAAEYYCVSAETGLLYPATEEEAAEYVLSGEMDQVNANDGEAWQVVI